MYIHIYMYAMYVFVRFCIYRNQFGRSKVWAHVHVVSYTYIITYIGYIYKYLCLFIATSFHPEYERSKTTQKGGARSGQ